MGVNPGGLHVGLILMGESEVLSLSQNALQNACPVSAPERSSETLDVPTQENTTNGNPDP